jgi:hypothetical protein
MCGFPGFHNPLRSISEDQTTPMANSTADELFVAISILALPQQENVDFLSSSSSVAVDTLWAFN